MGVALPKIRWLAEELGVSPALTRPRHLEIVRSEETTTFTDRALLYGANAVGKLILEATDLADLQIRIDEALESPLLSHVRQIVATEFFEGCSPSEKPGPNIQDILPAQLAQRFEEAAPVFCEAARLMKAYRSLQRATGVAPPSQPQQDALGTYYDPSLPPAFLRQQLQIARGDVAALALHAAPDAPRLPEWLAEALVEFLVAGTRALVRLVSSFPGIDADEKFAPISERLALEQLCVQNARAETGARVLVLLSEAQGDNPSTPWTQVRDEP